MGLKKVVEEDYVTYALYPQVAEKFLKGEIRPRRWSPQRRRRTGRSSARRKALLIEMDGQVKEIKIEALDAPLPPAGVAVTAQPQAEVAEETSANGAVTSPMQGTILKVNVKVGDSVKKGDVIAVLEAMKMENDIVAHGSGIVRAVYAQKGKNVDANAVLAVIE